MHATGTATTLDELFDTPWTKRQATVNPVPQRHLSPFRYPGGKTWLAPKVLEWVRLMQARGLTFVEPFAGGGIVSLSVAAAGLADKVVMVEIDPDVGAVWSLLIDGEDSEFEWLSREIRGFEVTRDAVLARLQGKSDDTKERAFRTILRNRMNRGGIMAPNASLLKQGEKNRGLTSRWYPETLVRRMAAIRIMRSRIRFVQGDAFEEMERYERDPRAVFFVDPPYTAGGGKVGARLYAHSVIDHSRLFALSARMAGPVVLTYDDLPEVRGLAAENGFSVLGMSMFNTHNKVKQEVAIGRGDVWGVATAALSVPETTSEREAA